MTEENKIEKLTTDELQQVTELRNKVLELTTAAEKAATLAENADLKLKVFVQQIFINKRLDPQCSIDVNTGVILTPPPVKEDEKKKEEVKTDAVE